MTIGRHMIAGTAAHRRRAFANTNAMTDYEADLTSRDRAKQKEAVRKVMAQKVRNDWEFEWPRPEGTPSQDVIMTDNAQSVVSLEPKKQEAPAENWRLRDEWVSDEPGGQDESMPSPAMASKTRRRLSSFGIGKILSRGDTLSVMTPAMTQEAKQRQLRRKKRLTEEMAYNQGLRCFVERRNAWTGCRRVYRSRSHAPSTHLTPPGPAPLSQTRSASGDGSSTLITDEEGSVSVSSEHDPQDPDHTLMTGADENEGPQEWEYDSEVPIPKPLLPPTNAMRASIGPGAYNTIYDKVILQQLTPSCPMNLKDITRSCVQGWKRDGDWPPKGTYVDSVIAAELKAHTVDLAEGSGSASRGKDPNRRRLSVAALLGGKDRDKDGGDMSPTTPTGGGIRKGIQKILMLGAKENTAADG